MPQELPVIESLLAWAGAQPEVRTLILTSSHAKPHGRVDPLSAYDVLVAVTDAARWASADAWVSDYGCPLVRWSDQSQLHGCPTDFRGVIDEDCVKIDYILWPAALVERVGARSLPAILDDGYRVLLDKDNRTAGWPSPSGHAFVAVRPADAEYRQVVDWFWWTTTYVAKSLWR